MKEWELTSEEIKETFKGKVIFASSPEMEREAEANLVGKAYQKKLVEWLIHNCYDIDIPPDKWRELLDDLGVK